MLTLETTQTVPLERWKDGTIRVGGSRLLFDMVVNAHNRGACPEEIFESFPSKDYTVADIYAVVAYYLQHKPQLDAYLKRKDKVADELRKRYEESPQYQLMIDKMCKRIDARRKELSVS